MDVPRDIGHWRKLKRAELLARREAAIEVDYRQWNASVTSFLLKGFPLLQGMTVGIYWPFRGEFDPRFAMRELKKHGATAALPVVVQKASPLQFREWWPGAPMTRGVFNLPIPAVPSVVHPQALLIPPVGFDERGYRLGYGGGYFDRTLASMTPMPLKIGVAFELSRITTIHPQHHDVPMDFIITEAGIHDVTRNGLEHIGDTGEVAKLCGLLVREQARNART